MAKKSKKIVSKKTNNKKNDIILDKENTESEGQEEVKVVTKKQKSNNDVNENSNIWWIIGLICPLIGILVYFKYKNRRIISSKALFGIILGTCMYLFVAFAILVGQVNQITIKEEDQTIENWQKDILNDELIVTVAGMSTCSHCQEYKPVITKLAQKYHFKLYFFELDKLTDDEYNILMNKYNYENYEGTVPYTFVVKKDKFIVDKVGYKDRNDLMFFLKQNSIVK